jgi:hypothetical protein
VRRTRLLLLAAAALSCAQPPAKSGFVLRVGVTGPIGEVSPEAGSGPAVLAGDVLFEPLATPRPGGWSSKFLRRWERLGLRRWRLEFEPGARFSNGTPVGPDDIARALRPQGFALAGASGNTLEVESRSSGRPLEVALAMGIVARRDGDRFLGTGAFAVEAQTPDHLVMRRVEPAPGRVAQVELVACSSGREAFARLLRGEVNAMFPIDRAFGELLDGVPGLRVVRGSSPNATAVFFGPGLAPEERRALAAWFPVGELAAAMKREVGRQEPRHERPPLPPGRPLRIGYPRSIELSRAALALRLALGPRGGEVVALGPDEWARRAAEFDLFINTILVRPPGVAALYFETGAPYNWTRYSSRDYDAALAAGDEAAAEEALRLNPPAATIARRELLAAVDARLPEAKLGDWGAFELVPEWEVAP